MRGYHEISRSIVNTLRLRPEFVELPMFFTSLGAAAVHPNGRLDGEPQRHFRLVGALDAMTRIAPRGHRVAENAEVAAESASSATFLAVPANQGS